MPLEGVVRVAAERGREVEAESVDAELLDPVPQRVEDELAHDRL